MRRTIAIPLSVVVALTALGCYPQNMVFAPEPRPNIVAIDVAIEGDRTPSVPSTVVKPHVTVLQGFLNSSDLHAFTASLAMVMATTDFGRVTATMTGAAGAAMMVDPSPELRRLHERVLETFLPFAVDPDTARSYIVTPDGSSITESALQAVGGFVPHASHTSYRPQLVAGTGQSAAASFKPMGAAVYLLDRAGNAQRTLWTWTGDSGAR